MSYMVMDKTLSILIPAKNEEWLGLTVEDILRNIEGDTNVIVVLDGYETPVPKLPEDGRLTVIVNETSVGQRSATNQACRYSTAKYVMKVDAHCSFDKGFDVKLMEVIQDDWTIAPAMRNLHVFDWVCDKGHRRYQGESGVCTECGGETHKEVVWIAKPSPFSTSYCFDEEPHFQYFNDFAKRAEGKGDLCDSMSLQGSCFMLTRDKYWELNISDESLGSWGSQGIEVACKTWLSGGRVVVYKKTWYSHLFRTKGSDFGFPYKQDNKQVQNAKMSVRKLFFDNLWDKQTRPLSWLIERFWPVPGWSEEMRQKIKSWPLQRKTRGIIYYSDNQLKWSIAKEVRKQIKSIGLPIVSCTLKPADMGKNIVHKGQRGVLTLFKQILTALENSDADIIYFCEHDILYHPSHFDFIPTDDGYYYNNNLWRLRLSDGYAVKYDHKSLSQLVGTRTKLIEEFRERVRRVESEGFHKGGYEPGTRSKRLGGFSDDTSHFFNSVEPNVDIRHDGNFTASKWKPEDFKQQRSCRNWQVGKCPEWAKNIITNIWK